MTVNLDMFQLLLAGVIALLLGQFINSKVPFLRRICIPAPVTGGIIVSCLSLLMHGVWGFDVQFDTTLKEVCMLMFFTSVGFQSNFTVFKTGGRQLGVLLALVAVLIVLQNLVGVSLAKGFGINPLVGLSAGSVTMAGGHGTAGGFTALMESCGLVGAGSIMMSTATFGLLAGSLLGGPMGEHLVEKFHLCGKGNETADATTSTLVKSEKVTSAGYTKAAFEICIAMGLGSLLSKALALTGLTLPTYFGALIVAAIIRNFTELVPHCPKLSMNEVVSIGSISLSLFLGMAMVSLRLWELSGVALHLLVILLAQVLLIALFARFAAFPLLGRDYDAAMLVAGLCGFGLGATPNAMANMTAVSAKYRYSTVPFIVVPLVGAMFLDIMNVTIITAFLHLI